ncbi:MAG: M20/M25/M40 family metallo-hydrolase [Bryobacteraceae bacterium]
MAAVTKRSRGWRTACAVPFVLVAGAWLTHAQSPWAYVPLLAPQMRIVIAHITANSLRGHLSFLASDLLEGRDTPSRGLDIAGEYIAAHFRRLNLEPGGDNGYFQTVTVYPERPDSPTSRNVIGILRGSDPKLKDTYVMLSSHYDHRGIAETGDDRIFNGANDDASGTASVMEVATALASLHPRTKRSVIFILFCGEEKGLRGSRYYVEHPTVSLAKTIAHLNLEQVGRTDATEGTKVGIANVTGFDFSSMVPALVDAGRRVNVKILKDAASSDTYFNRSDNGSTARMGIPAHTLSVAYNFPDYHAVGDEWQKIDFENMTKIDQAVGIAILNLADAYTAPKWNSNYPAAQPYVDAAKKLAEQ